MSSRVEKSGKQPVEMTSKFGCDAQASVVLELVHDGCMLVDLICIFSTKILPRIPSFILSTYFWSPPG